MKTYRLYKTDLYSNMAGVGTRVVYYIPEIDETFIRVNGGFTQCDCSRDFETMKETKYFIEWEEPKAQKEEEIVFNGFDW